MVTFLFWFSLGVLFYTFVGYPLMLVVAAALVRRREPPRGATPAVCVVIAAHDEAGTIDGKLANTLALDYPRERLRVIVVNDGSSDDTAARVGAWTDRGVELIDRSRRAGKWAALNEAVAASREEIVAFTDASSRLEPSALRHLVRHFAAPDVGVVCGRYRLGGSAKGSSSEGLYWRYEGLMKKAQGRLGLLVGAHGALYALRRRFYRPLPPNTINDDFVIPLQAVASGARCVCEPRAVAWETEVSSPVEDFKRRTRIMAGNWQMLVRQRALWVSVGFKVWWGFYSHKVLRMIAPAAAVTLFASSALGSSVVSSVALKAQVLLYVAAVAGALVRNHPWFPRVLSAPFYFVLTHWAAVVGAWRFLTGTAEQPWPRPIKSIGRAIFADGVQAREAL